MIHDVVRREQLNNLLRACHFRDGSGDNEVRVKTANYGTYVGKYRFFSQSLSEPAYYNLQFNSKALSYTSIISTFVLSYHVLYSYVI